MVTMCRIRVEFQSHRLEHVTMLLQISINLRAYAPVKYLKVSYQVEVGWKTLEDLRLFKTKEQATNNCSSKSFAIINRITNTL